MGRPRRHGGPQRFRPCSSTGARALVLSGLCRGQHQAAQARGHPHAHDGLGPARARPSPHQLRRALPDLLAHGQPNGALSVLGRSVESHRSHAQGRPGRGLGRQLRLPRLDLQAEAGREVAQHAARERAGAGGRRHQVLLRGLRQGGCPGLHLRGDRGHRDPGQVHGSRTPEEPQHDVPAEPGRARGRDLPQGSPGRGRGSQEAHDRHRAVHAEGAHAQGTGGAGAESRLL